MVTAVKRGKRSKCDAKCASINVTTGTNIAALLGDLAEFDVVCVQEHKTLEAEVAAASQRVLAAGWKSFWTPAIATAKGGVAAGTCILVKKHVDAWHGTAR